MAGDPDALDKTSERLAAASPLGRAGMPADIAETLLFLLGDAGSYISGQCIVVDAGLTAGASMSPAWAKPGMMVAR